MDAWGMAANIASLALALISIWLSIHFYVSGRQTESAVRDALTEIRVQTNMLQQLAGRQLDRLTKFVTTREDKSGMDSLRDAAAKFLAHVPQMLTTATTPTAKPETPAVVIEQLATAHMALYFYAIQANLFAQDNIPGPAQF